MAHFQQVEYRFFNESGVLMGTMEGFLRGIEEFHTAAYAEKYIDNQFYTKIVMHPMNPELVM